MPASSASTTEQRGVETTARRLDGLDILRRDLFKKSIKSPGWPSRLLTFHDERAKAECKLIVGKPHFRGKDAIGRNTQSSVAYDCIRKQLVYLKDTWRVVRGDLKGEGDVLRTLNTHKVPCAPTLNYNGDVGQVTLSQDLCRRYFPHGGSETRCPLAQHQHYWLVVQEIGKPLSDFESGKDLLVKMVPEDIPPGRIFLSVSALEDCEKPIVLQDDLESFFHVPLYMAIRFLSHNCPPSRIGQLLNNFFDEANEHKHGTPQRALYALLRAAIKTMIRGSNSQSSG
ncbi:hypothetical protein C8Q77DRAFT_1161700 [Trametes polyzona]|nr:hypothetical protein C8Q77DRAFT_1161700 [Trametes polyzona]